ncbi:hypothetical protein W97_02527 [Coniosporium apollinis CBS 100218]|uniref:DUF8004 domain-containing protein n=1 Tax=Coniosporium apollinis (strain CBS 100218) TaxID=1168221 RepID=R7YMZ1_CONA1|nr:uncharacterized protein W97_02527 [Coniosporium apollinis CBS 100218]EON63300.1 hypothetical protein W97_02527 [Coniosporium apollinis CBS 100218]
MRNPNKSFPVKRWDGANKTSSDWDGLRRDSELWFDDGDCLVHLYAKGNSRRGPSIRVPFAAIQEARSGAIFDICFAQLTPQAQSDYYGFGVHDEAEVARTAGKYELYIPAPEDAKKEDAFLWHITTRNYFAFLAGKPLVGSHLGRSLVDLQERLHLFRNGDADNHKDLMAYMEDMGYLNFVHCPDHALAVLFYAEHYQLRDLWIDAFAHCVGMNDLLCLSTELEPICRVTKALITRAYLEMDLHVGRVERALSTFLEDDLSASRLGVSQGARNHLERFRSFLHSFYVEKFSYWPPPEGSSFSKPLYRSMYFDFRSLYDFLVDMESSDALIHQKPANGGICVLQNIQAFDRRHKYEPLPHPLPLIPEIPLEGRSRQSQRSLIAFRLESKNAKNERQTTVRAILSAATNTRNTSIFKSPLVRAYARFEREWSVKQEEKVSIADARRVRWIMIYAILQMLVSVMRAPKEVRNSEEPSYLLCCLTAGCPPWKARDMSKVLSPALEDATPRAVQVPTVRVDAMPSITDKPLPATPSPRISIHPDCEVDYFSGLHGEPPLRPLSIDIPAPLRITPSGSTPASIKRNDSMSAIKTLSSAFSSRRSSVVVKPAPSPFHEIMIHGYGNGTHPVVVDPPSATSQVLGSPFQRPGFSSRPWTSGAEEGIEEPLALHRLRSQDSAQSAPNSRPSNLRISTAPALETLSRSPILEAFQLDHIHESTTPALTDSPVSASINDHYSYSSAPLTPIWSSGSEDGCSLATGTTASTSKRNSVSSSHYGTAPPTPVIASREALPRSWTSALVNDEQLRRKESEELFTSYKHLVVIRKSVSLESLRLGREDASNAEVDIFSALSLLPEKEFPAFMPAHARHSAVDLSAARAPALDMSLLQDENRSIMLKVGDVVRDVSQVTLPISRMMGREARQKRRITMR